MVDITLLPKREAKPQEISKEEKQFPSGIVIALIIVIATGVLTGGIFLYKNLRQTNLNRAQAQVDDLIEQEKKYGDMENQAKTLQQQLQNLKTLLAKHVYYSVILSEVSELMPKNIQLINITIADSGQISISGVTDPLDANSMQVGYSSVSKLVTSLKNSKKLESVELGSAERVKFEEKDKLRFTITFNIKTGVLLKEDQKSNNNQENTNNNPSN